MLLSGCATAFVSMSKTDRRIPYGGTMVDGTILISPGEVGGSGHLGFWVIPLYPLALLDLPFSFIADTVMLPFTLQGEKVAPPASDAAASQPEQAHK